MNGAEITAAALRAAGVRRVFSLSGNQILPLYDALLSARIEIVHTRHEGAAVHMADAWARLTGNCGVCLVTAGPGHANALGALAFAEAAESPVLLLSGHAPLGKAGAFQEMDQVGLARPITRWAGVAGGPEEIPALLNTAFRAAQERRPGPVHLSLPADVLTADAAGAGGEDGRRAAAGVATQPPVSDESPVEQAIALLREAERPLILTGPAGGRPGVHELLDTFSNHTGVPYFVVDHPRGLQDPALGRAGQAVPRADVVLLLAKRQDYRVSYGGPPVLPLACRLLQIDPWPEEVGRHRPVEVGIVDGAASAAQRLLDAARRVTWPRSGWAEEVASLRAAPLVDIPADQLNAAPLHPWRVFDELASLIQGPEAATTCVLDGGEFGQWARARLRLRPPQHLVAEPSGGIGFSLPFAIAAKLARQEQTIIAVAGDGAFGFYAMELETAVRTGAACLVIVGTDGAWGTERHLQVSRYGAERTVATDLLLARYDRLAESLGGHGEYVETPAELRPALTRALRAVAAGQPAVVNVRIASIASPAGEPPR